jgi:uncharacterized membrane protein YbhN (UPF0104 family)
MGNDRVLQSVWRSITKDPALDQRYFRNDAKPEAGGAVGAAGHGRAKPLIARVLGLEHAAEDGGHAAGARRHSIGKILATLFSLAIAAFSIYILVHTFSAVSFSDLAEAIEATSAGQIAAAALLTVVSFTALTGYDALASFTSYAISFTLGFPLITAGTVRYWIYSQVGLTASKVASLTVIAGVTFWFGMIFVIGVGLAFHGAALSEINQFNPILNALMGFALLAGIVGYLVWVTIRRRHVRIQGFRFELPGLGLTIGQILLGVIDQCAAAGVLFVLLPRHSEIDFLTFAPTYVFACILGVASNAPGGIGVFEAAMLKAMPVSHEALLASLLLFRFIYYLAPFFLALAFLGTHESFRRWKSLREAMRRSEEDAASLPDEID